MRKVMITGAAGMIGSHLVEALLDRGGCQVVGMDDLSFGRIENLQTCLANPSFSFHQASVLDEAAVAELARGCEQIVHLAAVKKIGNREPALPTLHTNVRGTEVVFGVALAQGAKVLLASTSDVYGMSPDLPHREDGDLLLGPSMIKRWSYAVSKLYGEQLAFAYHQDEGLPVVVLRYFGGFSPRSSFGWSGGHIPIFVRAILRGEEVPIHGDGTQTRSMAYVSDLVEGTLLAMESPRAVGQLINLGNDEEMSVLDAARLIHELADTGQPLRLRHIPMQELFGPYKDVNRRRPDLSRAREILGYRPRVSMRRAVELMLSALRADR